MKFQNFKQIQPRQTDRCVNEMFRNEEFNQPLLDKKRGYYQYSVMNFRRNRLVEDFI